MIDFGVLPPEINSGRMYLGPGAGPMLAAATSWDALADELGSAAASFESTVTDLADGPWKGPVSMSMTAAALPYAAWLKVTSAQAEHAALAAKAAAAAYETAFAMTVPPPVIAANRAQLLLLIATNFFGQNTPAIAATEAHYVAMWAQDATAMYGYAGDSRAATKVSPFTQPPQITDSAGLAQQAAAVGHSAGTAPGAPTTLPPAPAHPTALAVTQPLNPVTAPAVTSPPATIPPGTQAFLDYQALFLQYSQAETSPVQFTNVGMRILFNGNEFPNAVKGVNGFLADAAKAAQSAGTSSMLTPAVGGGIPVVGVGQAVKVGPMSVPPSWPGATPAVNRAATLVASRAALPAATSEAPARGMFGMPGLPGATAAAGGGYGFRFVPRYGYRHRMMTQPPDGKVEGDDGHASAPLV